MKCFNCDKTAVGECESCGTHTCNTHGYRVGDNWYCKGGRCNHRSCGGGISEAGDAVDTFRIRYMMRSICEPMIACTSWLQEWWSSTASTSWLWSSPRSSS